MNDCRLSHIHLESDWIRFTMLTLWIRYSRIGIGASIESRIGLIVHLVHYIMHPPDIVENLDESMNCPLNRWIDCQIQWIKWFTLNCKKVQHLTGMGRVNESFRLKKKKVTFSLYISAVCSKLKGTILFQTLLSDYRWFVGFPCGFFPYLATNLFQIYIFLIIQLSYIFVRILVYILS